MKCFFSDNFKYLSGQREIKPTDWSEVTGIPVEKISAFLNEKTFPDAEQLLKISDFMNYPVNRMLAEDISATENIINNFDFKFLVLDIDGVLTDGGIFYTESGDEIKKFNAKDGLAIIRLTTAGNNVGFISSGFREKMITHRAQVLGVQKVFVGTWKKIEVLDCWCEEMGISFNNVAYIGDDINDLPVIEKVGLTACPADAAQEIKEKVNIVLSLGGGKGCVREFVDKYLSKYTKSPF